MRSGCQIPSSVRPVMRVHAIHFSLTLAVAILALFGSVGSLLAFGPVGTVFEANRNSSFAAPPDPACAAGPEVLVGAVNSNIAIWDKFGDKLFESQFISGSNNGTGFFDSVRTGNVTINFVSDPRVIYDQYINRFIVIDLGINLTQNGFETSYLLIAISTSSSPRDGAGWHKFALQTSTSSHWSDYPTLGIDEDTIYLTYNMFPKAAASGGFSRMHQISKANLADPINPPVALDDRFFGGGVADAPRNANGGLAFTIQPAHTFGPAVSIQTEWFVSIDNQFSQQDQVFLYNRDGGTSPNVFRLYSVTVPPFEAAGAALQRGNGPALETVADRMNNNAVWRDDSLWCCHTIQGPNGPAVRWYQFDTSAGPNSAPFLVQSGDVILGPNGVSGSFHNFMPGIMVNPAGDMLVSYTCGGPNSFLSLCYAHRFSTDALDTTRVPTTVVEGITTYTAGGFFFPVERWGDYSGIALDPADEATFWMFHEVANAAGDWQTWFGSATLTLTGGPPGPPVPPAPNQLILERPNQFVNFVTDTTERVSWSFVGGRADSPVDLLLFRDDSLVGKIAEDLRADQANADWDVGTLLNGAAITPGETYRVRVQAVNNPSIFDESTAFFRITERVEVEAGVFDSAGLLQSPRTFGPGEAVELVSVASLGMGPYFYKWTPQDFLDNPNIARPVARPLRGVTYTVTVRDATGNDATAEVELIAGNPLRIDAGETRLFPSGGSVVLEGSLQGGNPPYTIEWFDCDPTICADPAIANTIQPVVSPAGLTAYFLRVTDGTGEVRSDNVLVEPGFNVLLENDPGNGGIINRSPIQSLYRFTDAVDFTAMPATGFLFDHWENGAVGSSNPVTVSFPSENITIRAVYRLEPTDPGPSTTPPSPDCGLGLFGGLAVSALALLFVKIGRPRRRRRRVD